MIIRYEPGSLRIRGGVFAAPADEAWRGALEASRAAIQRAIAGVGRLELQRAGRTVKLGSGWLARADVVVTNRHTIDDVRREIAAGEVEINMLAERHPEEAQRRRISAVLAISSELDLAFLRVEAGAHPVIALATAAPEIGQRVCAIGFPTGRLAHYEPARARKCFPAPFDVKRLSPGTITGLRADRVEHDCATLGGNSGGVLLDVVTGAAVGLHYGGQWSLANHAVPAALVARGLAALP